MENLFFPVEKVKLTDLGFNYPVPSDASHAVVGTIGGSKRILSFCSPDYGITPNRELANHLETVLQDSGVKIRSRHGSTRGNSSFRMEWVLDIHQESIQGGAIAPRIYLYNSYNRKTRFSASFGVMRLICTNGLSVLEESKVTSNLHSSGLNAFVAIEQLVPGLNDFLEEFDTYLEPLEDLATIRVPSVTARFDEIISNTSYPANLKEVAMEVIEKEMAQLKIRPTDYMVYTALNYGLVHDPRYLGNKGEKIDREVLAYMMA